MSLPTRTTADGQPRATTSHAAAPRTTDSGQSTLRDNRLVQRLAVLRRDDRRGLAPYLTAGDGGLDRTRELLAACDAAGATCVELGLPFSDPIADGPILQAAADRALAAGTTLAGVCATLADFRRTSALPVVVMTYANPLLAHGWEASAAALGAAGADGLLVADVPVEEGGALRAAALAAGLCPQFFAAATTSDARLAASVAATRGFLYAVGRFGVTGKATAFGEDAQAFLARVRDAAGELPVAVGFGIGTPGSAVAATRHADLAIIGSALVDRVHAAGDAGPAAALDMLAPIVEALAR